MRSILTLITVVFFIACKRDNVDPTPDPDPNLEENVYITGEEGNPLRACAWKGSQLIKLHTSNNSKITSEGSGIWVSGDDVYVAGQKINEDAYEGVYWKNQTEFPLERGTDQAFIYDLFMSGSDVYVVGSIDDDDDRKAAYWKNGKLVILGSSDIYTNAHGIAVDGNDVYVAGFEVGRTYKAILWKNGVREDLIGGKNSMAHDVEVVNNKVYVVGEVWDAVSTEPDPVYWLNGDLNSLKHEGMYGSCSNLAIDGNDLYFPLTLWNNINSKTPAYWKNGVVTKLDTPAESNYAVAVKIKNGDVYVVGKIGPSQTDNKAVYWKNGVKVVLPSTGSITTARGIFIK